MGAISGSERPRDLASLRQEQERLARRVSLADRQGPISLVAGVDVHYLGGMACAAAVLLSFPALEVLAAATAQGEAPLPYIPGYLSFREAPTALAAVKTLPRRPHLLLADGQGIAHPRGLGLACHLGVLSGLMTIGVAKSRLVGKYRPPGGERGRWAPLFYGDRLVGAVLRTRAGVKPVFVSPGHKISLPTAIRLTMACTGRYRQPEPLRAAHRLAASLHGKDLNWPPRANGFS